MPRTAPTWDGTPNYLVVSYRWIDADGKKESTSYITNTTAATTANIEAMAVALAAASNANLYAISVESVEDGAPSASTANEALRESVKDFVNTLVRDPVSRKSQEVAIPAPLEELLIEGTTNVDVSNALYQAVNTAANALLPAAYVFVSTRFAEHKSVNQKTNF
jgi:hypothetical protein